MKHLKTYKVFEKKVPSAERDDIYRDDKYILVSPLSHNASCKYGAFSDWCISVPNEDYMWDMNSKDNRGTIVIMLIQRGLEYDVEREEKIHKYKTYQQDIDSGEELSEEERDDMIDLEKNGDFLDLRKIAFVYSKSSGSLETWTNNNIDITDMYYGDGLYNLPIDDYIIDEVFNYIGENK